MEINFFDKNVKKFISELEKKTLQKAVRTLDLLEKYGSDLRMPHSKKISSNLFELRVHGSSEVRIFYTFYKNKIILLSGFIKKTQLIPRQLILLAKSKLKSLENS